MSWTSAAQKGQGQTERVALPVAGFCFVCVAPATNAAQKGQERLFWSLLSGDDSFTCVALVPKAVGTGDTIPSAAKGDKCCVVGTGPLLDWNTPHVLSPRLSP